MEPKPSNEREAALFEWALLVAGLKQQSGMPDENNLELTLLKRGEFFVPQVLPPQYKFGGWRECFMNAFRAAGYSGDPAYVEGYAFVHIPTHHAWNALADNLVIDTTWRTRGKKAFALNEIAYFGVRIDYGVLSERLLEKKTYGYFPDR